MFRIFSGYLAGLSVGIYCIGVCLPVFLPILLSEERSTKKSFRLIYEFSLGRLMGYLAFGSVFGFLGQIITNSYVHIIVSLGNVWAGILMIIFSLGMIDKKICAIPYFHKIKWPLLLGFLTGVNVCPPFLASLTHIFNLKDILASIAYFFMFFLGATTYIIPAAFLGFFTKSSWIQKIARFSGVLVGIYFIAKSTIKFL
jgi:sulfite exporter TauE/SafE